MGAVRRSIWACSACLVLAGSAHAASKDVHYGPAPSWVEPPPIPTDRETPADAPLRVVYLDNQTRVTRDAEETHSAFRIKVLKPEALAIGNLTGTWNPSTDDITINGLKIIRDGKTIDVLARTKFGVIEREDKLDYAVLDGALTASVQTPGLQVGDELEFALTISRHDTTFGGRSSDIAQLALAGAPGAFRSRLLWDKGVALRWRATPDLGTPTVQAKGGEQELVEELRDPSSALLTDGAPPRFNMRRMVMFSTFDSWSQLSNLFAALFDRSTVLAPDSPLHAEAAKIAASTTDPKLRAEAALRLVQDRIRYVFVGLNGGAYRPASTGETWRRRFGDCKAKTVLLIALLRELGVESEAVLVNSTGGDITPKLLPTPMAFDHVLVRATIAGHRYWLDGTRSGDRRLETAPSPTSRWGLPIRQGATDIEAIPPEAPSLPQLSVVLDIDATAGFDKPAKVRSEEVLRGDGVQAVRTQLSAMSPEDSQRAVKADFHKNNDWADADTGAWRYDEAQQVIVLTATGTGKPAWEGDAKDGRTLEIAGAGFTPPDQLRRPKEQEQTAPWLTDFPRFRRWTTIIRLPPPDPGKHWDYAAKPADLRLGGVARWREAQLDHGVMRTTMSIRTYLPEISPAQAKEIEDSLPTFDKNISQVFETGDDPAEAAPAKVATVSSKDAKTLTDTGMKAMRDGHLDDAVKLFDQALAANPKFTPALVGKLNALSAEYRYSEALVVLDALQATSPKAELQVNRASLLYAAGRTEDASKAIDAWLLAQPGKWQVLFGAAQLEAGAGLFDRAMAHVDAGLKLEPENASLLRLRASVEEREGRRQDALTDADAAIHLRPEDRGAFVERGTILIALQRPDEALADLDEAWRMDPIDSGVEITRGTILSRLGREAEAGAMYDDVLARGAGETANNVCWAMTLANVDLPRAETICADAVKLEPQQASFWDSYALVALRSGRLDVAKTRYDRALALNPRLAPSLYARGIVKVRQGDTAGGATDIAAAKALNAYVARELTEAGVTLPDPRLSPP